MFQWLPQSYDLSKECILCIVYRHLFPQNVFSLSAFSQVEFCSTVSNCYFALDLTVIMSQSGITAPMVLKCCPKVLDASDMVMPCPNTVILPTRVWYSHETILTTLSTQTLWGQELLGHKEARKKRQIKMMAVFFLIFLIPDIYIVYAACCLLSTLVQYSLLSSLLQNVLILLT